MLLIATDTSAPAVQIKLNTSPALTNFAGGFSSEVEAANAAPAGIAAVSLLATQTFAPGAYENTAKKVFFELVAEPMPIAALPGIVNAVAVPAASVAVRIVSQKGEPKPFTPLIVDGMLYKVAMSLFP